MRRSARPAHRYPKAQAHSHQNLAWVLYQQGRGLAALDHAWEALDAFRAAGATRRPNTPTAVARPAIEGPQQAVAAYIQEATVHIDDVGDRQGQSNTWQTLGHLHVALGDHEQAIHCYRQALRVWSALDPCGDADILTHLGDAHRAVGDRTAAREVWKQALDILDELHHPDADAVRYRFHG
jgi:tetratricopeptide (TPR) repeat protein